jgi:hypothetical protein
MKKSTGFYWEVINPKTAKDLFKNGVDIYKLFDDDTESLVVSEHDLNDSIDLNIELAIEKYFV